ncbi:MAG: class I SAM-dependent methyltransferase [Alphaproteobacteria bacterium]|nr:class I SAM-dependent methyltransferase [Alphaproteobacteria bacterium]MDE2109867.1 class I SAM-dependent methyltransferase [Alphaproteobacteria bacterium]MDE2493551.1 class I SAM-dependent methyltransferase [Alphaproteobacteria bacterium]
MTDTVDVSADRAAGVVSESSAKRSLLGRFAAQYADVAVPFEVVMPNGTSQRFGQGAAAFRIGVNNRNGLRAIASLDEGRIGNAYLAGDIDIDGDMVKPFELRGSMKDFHIVTELWRYIQPLLFGQVRTNRAAITSHYDIPAEFFLSFLDPKTPCYTQGVYESPDETLDVATLRKFDYAFEKLKLKPGDRILEIGPGWGAWFEYASARGVKCTGISISKVSIDYLRKRAKELGRDWELIESDLLEYKTDRKYDAVVIMGVIEHLPDYLRVLRKFMSLLKPGGRIFLDGSACTRKFELSSYMVKYIYPGNHSFLVLHDFLDKLARTPLQVEEIFNDRVSYFRTFVQWAKNLDANKDFVVEKFGAFNYRRFRLYLWGATYEFLSRSLDCYRMIIHYPEDAV